MKKLEAIKFLVRNNVYGNEWQGAGMYEVIEEVVKQRKGDFDENYLIKLLQKAKDF